MQIQIESRWKATNIALLSYFPPVESHSRRVKSGSIFNRLQKKEVLSLPSLRMFVYIFSHNTRILRDIEMKFFVLCSVCLSISMWSLDYSVITRVCPSDLEIG